MHPSVLSTIFTILCLNLSVCILLLIHTFIAGASIGSMGESSFSDSYAVSVSGALDVFQTPPTTTGESTPEQNTQLIIMDTFYQQRGTQLTDLEPSNVEDFSNPEYILPILPEASDKLLLDPASLNSSEVTTYPKFLGNIFFFSCLLF